ncbi:HAD family hydrolase [Hymenobacter cavernae]|uniref:phosphoglycolate phosphatase n=1 Tax=Hymenobacter cavernae TaxID=2044852 RepID=A0ABQ1TGC3_9BACT|nr:HAD family hydrolase [Hymenobacter cavernae]GGE93643.1 phosphoglycolate phosphatase [Hymenobacter cavernae]
MAYSLLLFDYDGTLCDSRQAIYHSLQQFFLTYNLPTPPEADVQRTVEMGLSAPVTLQVLQPTATPAQIIEWVPIYRGIYAEQGEPLVKPFPGAQQVLAQAAAQGFTPVVFSNKGSRVLEASLERFEMLPFISLLIGDGSYPDKQLELKPSPMIFQQIIQPHFPEVPLDEILMIGDTQSDLLFARNCGIDSCWASYGMGDAAECRALGPTYEISGLAELDAVLQGKTVS